MYRNTTRVKYPFLYTVDDDSLRLEMRDVYNPNDLRPGAIFTYTSHLTANCVDGDGEIGPTCGRKTSLVLYLLCERSVTPTEDPVELLRIFYVDNWIMQ